jgi:pyruvate/2-oxoglutarate/acetoin dehydrogenase E1 component
MERGCSEMREIRFVEAMQEALREEMARDETVFILGECVRMGALGTSTGLADKFGNNRVLDTNISECAIAGSCLGAALVGYRPIADILCSDFFYIIADEMCNKAAKWRFRHGGKPKKIPIVYISSIGGYVRSDAEHSQTLESIIMHCPGLKLAIPSTPYDAKGLLKTAIRDDNPVVYLYHKLLMPRRGGVPQEEYTIPLGVADIKREGKDVTVVATGYMVQMALDVANQLQERGVSIEVVDPRTLEPLDIDTIVASVRKTRRVVIVDEDTLRCGVTAEIAVQIMENAFDELDAPIQRVAAANYPIPAGWFLEQYVLPYPKDIIVAIQRVLGRDLGPLEVKGPTSSLVELLEVGGIMKEPRK